MSLNGALGRSGTYSESATEKDKNLFGIALREKLDEISSGYQSMVMEEEHLSNIKRLSNELSSRFHHCLKNGRFRIGIAQKALNLYLKYLWGANLIVSPPHCPFDSIVIKELPDCRDLKWTSIDDIEDYSRLVKAARREAKDKPLPQWELEVWLNRVQSERARKGVRESGTGKRHKGKYLRPSQTIMEKENRDLIIGTIVNPSKNMYEITISKRSSHMLPHTYGEKQPIHIIIGNILYEAGVHETEKGLVWISSVLDKEEKGVRGEGPRLIGVLTDIGLKKGDKVIIKKNEDGNYLLMRYNDN